MFDIATPNTTKLRKDFGLQNVVGASSPLPPQLMNNGFRQQKVRQKVANFVQTAVYPQQLTIPRQYATTQEGCWIYKILEGRQLRLGDNGGALYREKGVRVVVQENAKQARFVMSPLFGSKHDALSWARQHMGVKD